MVFDYKKEYKEFYLPPRTPGIVTVPAMSFLAVRGQGDPNEEGGAYKQTLELLYHRTNVSTENRAKSVSFRYAESRRTV